MIITKQVQMVINQYNIDYYSQKLNQKLKCGDRISVDVDLLPPTSGALVSVQCEYCGEIFSQQYRRYVQAGKTGKHCCKKCRYIKIIELSEERHGTKCTLKLPEIHEKMVANNLAKYGTKHSVTPESYKKREKTMQERYGVSYTLQSPELRSRVNQTMFELGHNTVFSSRQQEYLCSLFGGISNYPIVPYHIDCYIENLGIGIEYSGKGHDLAVKLGDKTQTQFDGQEKARRSYFINHNIPIIEFISSTDKLPSDNVLQGYLEESIRRFQGGEQYIQIIFPY